MLKEQIYPNRSVDTNVSLNPGMSNYESLLKYRNPEVNSMRCLKNIDKTCSSTVITLEWEEYPACMTGKDCKHPLYRIMAQEIRTGMPGTV